MRHLVLLSILTFALGACGGEEGVSAKPTDPSLTRVPEVDMGKVLAFARETDRNVLIEYYGRDCNFCRQMDLETWADPEVKSTLEGVVYVRLHQNQNAAFFEKRWGKAGTPSFVVLRPDGTQIGTMLTGIIEVGDFLIYLDWATTGEEEQPEITTGGS